jgi:hypothetical protein
MLDPLDLHFAQGGLFLTAKAKTLDRKLANRFGLTTRQDDARRM